MRVRWLRILGLSFLALAGFMSLSASAAQARWLLLLNGVSVGSIDVNNLELQSRLLVPALGLAIECKESTGIDKWSTSEESKKLSVSGSSTSTGCVVSEFEEVCKVKSLGQSVGSIAISGSGPVGMEGAEVLIAKLSSSNFTDIILEGEECPFIEINGKVSGSILKTVLEALQNKVTRLTHLGSSGLSFGGQPATLESNEGGAVLGHETHVGNGTWAFHLVNL